MTNKAFIKDVSIFLPSKILNNEEFRQFNEKWTPDKIYSKIGVKSRHIIDNNETSLSIALQACKKLLDKNKDIADSIDYILYTTLNHEHFMLISSAIIQNRLNLRKQCCAIDMKLTCTGYLQALSIAKSLVVSNQASNVMLVTADTYSKVIAQDDIGTRSVFGDAATATLISNKGTAEILDFSFGTNGIGSENHIARTHCLSEAFPDEHLSDLDNGKKFNLNNFYMVGGEIFEFVAKEIPLFYNTILSINKLQKKDISLNVFHQANSYMLSYLRKKIGIPENRFYIDMEEVGNTSTSSIPIVLNNIFKKGLYNGNILLCSFGGGYTWGGNVIKL